MKKIVSILLCVMIFCSSLSLEISAADEKEQMPTVISFTLNGESDLPLTGENNTRASGLITSYGLSLEKSGTVLKIYGQTHAAPDVVLCGFKNLVIQRRASSSDSWKEYYDYGNVYADDSFANLSTTLSAASGYQYRISCKHYAKKNILSVQTISNTSNVIMVY